MTTQDEFQNSFTSESNVTASYASLHSQARLSRASNRQESRDNLTGSLIHLTGGIGDANGERSAGRVVKKTCAGLFLAAMVCLLWIGTLQCAKQIYMWNTDPVFYSGITTTLTPPGESTEPSNTTTILSTTFPSGSTNSSYHAADIPFVLTYLSVSSMSLFYPLYLMFCCCCFSTDSQQLWELHKLNMIVLRGEMGKKSIFALRASIFTIMWVLMTYCCLQSLRKITAMEMAAMFCVQPSFSYLLSWVVLQNKFLGIRVIAFILGASGVILNIYVEQPIMWFKVLASLSAVFYGIFNVMVDRFFIIYIPHIGQILLILSIVGASAMITTWPLIIIFNVLTSVETGLDLNAPWFLIAAVIPIYSLLVLTLKVGKIFTYDVFINLGFFLGLIVDAILEIMWFKTLRLSDLIVGNVGDLHLMKLAGLCLIMVGFLLTYFPAGWHQYLAKIFHITPRPAHLVSSKESSKKGRQRKV